MSTEKKKIKFDFIIYTVDGRPMKEAILGADGKQELKELHAADSLASFLSMRKKGEKMQYMEWARELFTTKGLELTEAQIKSLKKLIEEDEMTAVVEEAFVVPLDKALLKKDSGK